MKKILPILIVIITIQMSYSQQEAAFGSGEWIKFKMSYSGFLKANNQSAGLDSYSYVVALLVNYNAKHPL